MDTLTKILRTYHEVNQRVEKLNTCRQMRTQAIIKNMYMIFENSGDSEIAALFADIAGIEV